MAMPEGREHGHERDAGRPERVERKPERSTEAHPLLALQQSAGNRGVESLMRAPIQPVAAMAVQRVVDEQTGKRVRKFAQNAYEKLSNRIDHIKQRHGATSTATGAGKFLDNKKIYALVKDGVEKGTIDTTDGGYKFEYKFAEKIGKDISGRDAFGIRVILTGSGKDYFINTAFPIYL
jgi:hypothetical protein